MSDVFEEQRLAEELRRLRAENTRLHNSVARNLTMETKGRVRLSHSPKGRIIIQGAGFSKVAVWYHEVIGLLTCKAELLKFVCDNAEYLNWSLTAIHANSINERAAELLNKSYKSRWLNRTLVEVQEHRAYITNAILVFRDKESRYPNELEIFAIIRAADEAVMSESVKSVEENAVAYVARRYASKDVPKLPFEVEDSPVVPTSETPEIAQEK